jgi:molybdopterin synthase sulfur carrier subunit
MQVTIPQPLLSYTDQADRVDAVGTTLNELLDDLDRQYPGIRFRMINEQDEMRPHIIFFVGGTRTRNIEESLAGVNEVVILHALSGG